MSFGTEMENAYGSPLNTSGAGGAGGNSGEGDSIFEQYANVMYVKNPEEMLRPWTTNNYFWQIVLTYSVTFVIGLVGNVLSIVVMHCDHKLNNSTTVFLVSLSVADLLLLVVSAPLETLQYFVNTWDGSGWVCKLAKYCEMLSAVASVLNLCAVSLERFIVIRFPLICRALCTLRNCRRAVMVVWLLAIVLASPIIFTKDSHVYAYTNNVTVVVIHYCLDKENDNALAFAIYQFIILFASPATMLIICYIFVIRTLWLSNRDIKIMTNQPNDNFLDGSGKQLSGEQGSSHFKKESKDASEHVCLRLKQRSCLKTVDVRKGRKQVIKMLILIIVLFLVCWGPCLIMEICMKIGLKNYTPSVYQARVAFFLLPFVHSCINPFIYSSMSKSFRSAMKKQCIQGCGVTQSSMRRQSNTSYRQGTCRTMLDSLSFRSISPIQNDTQI